MLSQKTQVAQLTKSPDKMLFLWEISWLSYHLFDSNASVLEGWLKTVVDYPKDIKPKFQDKVLIGEHHQVTAVDLIHAGADGGELDAAEAEKEEEAVDDHNTVIATHPMLCEASCLVNDRGHIMNEYRTRIQCPFCEQEVLDSAPIEWKTRKFHAFTSQVRSEHDVLVYPSSEAIPINSR